MAIIYTYPSGAVKADDLILVSEQDSAGVPTKNITVSDLAAYLSGLPGGPWLPLSAGSTWPLTGDLYMAPAGSGFSVGSRNIVFRGIDDVGNELDSARIFTLDSTINPSGQDLYIQNANDVGALTTNIFVDAFGFVGIGKTNPGANLDIANDLIVGTNVQFGGATDFRFFQSSGSIGLGTSSPNFKMDIAGGDLRMEQNYGIRFGGTGSNGQNYNIRTTGDPFGGSYPGAFVISRGGEATNIDFTLKYPLAAPVGQVQFNQYGSGNFTGTAAYNLEVDASGNIIETTPGVSLPWLYEYDATDENFIQGEGPNPIPGSTGNTGYGVNCLPILNAGQNNTAVGANTGLNLEDSSDNVLIGFDTGRNFRPAGTPCDRNTLVGSRITFSLNPQGDDNTCVGYQAGSNIDTGFKNVFLGSDAGRTVSIGADNIAIGYKALEAPGGASRNIAIGSLALTVSQSSANNNTVVGYEGGAIVSTGDNNVLFGYQAGSTITTGNNNICIGYTAEPSSGTIDNEITIGNATHDNIRLPGSLPAFADDAAAGAGGILTNMLYQTDGAGAAPLNVAGIVMIKQ
jgi:hypothetical protein